MIFLIFFVMVFMMWFSVSFRVFMLHPVSSVINALCDIYRYFRYKKWRLCKTGNIICYIGYFRSGKTLSAVHDVVRLYRKYNDKKVYDTFRKKWVTQKVHIISNVELLTVPFEYFTSLSQIVSIRDRYKKIDEENNTLTVHLILGDEFSVQLNSRTFKSNIDAMFLNSLLTCGHYRMALYYTAQRFNHVDALLRQVTQHVISCQKSWRAMIHKKYDGYDLENASNPQDVQPLSRYGWFIRNRDFNEYDTLACVENLKKSCLSGDMLTEAQILDLQRNTPSDMDAVSRPSRKFLKRKKKVR